MNEIELYVHTAKHRDPKLIRISQDATIEELVSLVPPDTGENRFGNRRGIWN
jgi:hypothetical protein